MRKVVVTGAAGGLATRMLPALRERYELVLLDVAQTARKGGVVEDVIVADLMERDRDCYREYFRGADAVVHCAYRRVDRSDMEKHFSTEMDNITMAYNLYQICLEEGIRRAVVLSSNHAADFYEELSFSRASVVEASKAITDIATLTPEMTALVAQKTLCAARLWVVTADRDLLEETLHLDHWTTPRALTRGDFELPRIVPP